VSGGKFEVFWVKRGGPPKSEPNPHYPDGCHIDLTAARRGGSVKLTHKPPPEDERSCVAQLPYPVGRDEVGTWMIRCLTCGLRVGVTAASRPDDPKSVRMSCLEKMQ
jgi:hypothetical protein